MVIRDSAESTKVGQTGWAPRQRLQGISRARAPVLRWLPELLGVLFGPLRHRLGRRAGQFGDQVVGLLRMVHGILDLVEIPRRVRTERTLEGRFGFGPIALLIGDGQADADTDLFGDLRASQR